MSDREKTVLYRVIVNGITALEVEIRTLETKDRESRTIKRELNKIFDAFFARLGSTFLKEENIN